MYRLQSERRLVWIVLVAACWFGNPLGVMAEVPRMVVVVTDASDADAFRRIGNGLIDVEVLLRKDTGIEYELCNDRVKELRDFQFLFYREDVECSADRFWRQRLVAANRGGETLRLSQSRVSSDVERRVERAKAVHKALLAKFPKQRKQIDANFKSELQRLHLIQLPTLQFASFN